MYVSVPFFHLLKVIRTILKKRKMLAKIGESHKAIVLNKEILFSKLMVSR